MIPPHLFTISCGSFCFSFFYDEYGVRLLILYLFFTVTVILITSKNFGVLNKKFLKLFYQYILNHLFFLLPLFILRLTLFLIITSVL